MLNFKTLAAVASTAVLTTLASQAAAVTINFEDYTQDTVVTAGSDIGGGLSFTTNIKVQLAGFATNAPATEGYIAFNNTLNDFRGSVTGLFARTVTSLTLGAGDSCCDQDTVTLTGFDGMGNIVDSDTFTSDRAQFLSIAGDGIASFSLSQPNSGGFDNISFDLTAVPVPASLPLLAFGLAGFGWVARRKSA